MCDRAASKWQKWNLRRCALAQAADLGAGWLGQPTFISYSSKGWKSKTRVQANVIPGKASLRGLHTFSLCCTLTWQGGGWEEGERKRERSSLMSLLRRGPTPFTRALLS